MKTFLYNVDLLLFMSVAALLAGHLFDLLWNKAFPKPPVPPAVFHYEMRYEPAYEPKPQEEDLGEFPIGKIRRPKSNKKSKKKSRRKSK